MSDDDVVLIPRAVFDVTVQLARELGGEVPREEDTRLMAVYSIAYLTGLAKQTERLTEIERKFILGAIEMCLYTVRAQTSEELADSIIRKLDLEAVRGKKLPPEYR